jgi:hypothetical protein
VLPEGTATAPTPIGFDREIVGELAVAEEREWLVTTGTWLIGPFVDAHLRVHRDAVAARRFLDRSVTTSAPPPSAPSRRSSTGMRPFPLKGCIAQAWSVGEICVSPRSSITNQRHRVRPQAARSPFPHDY